MRVLLVNDYGSATGGAEVATLLLRDGLRRRGHDAWLLASSARPPGAPSLADAHCLGTTTGLRSLLQVANPSAVLALRRALLELRPDVVHLSLFLTQLSPLVLPLLARTPTLYHAHWYRAICPLGTKRLPDGSECEVEAGSVCHRRGCVSLLRLAPVLLQLRLLRRHRGVIRQVVATSEPLARRLSAEGISPVRVVPCGVPVVPFAPGPGAPPTVAFAGRLVPQKGAAVLVEAFARVVARIPDARLLLAGDGPEHTALERQVARLGLTGSVRLLGFLARNELNAALAPAWVQVVPSLWAEAFGLVAAEAMMRGRAVVASRAGGLPEIVEHGATGLLVPPGDAEALALALVGILADRDGAERMGRAGRARAEARFGEDAYIEAFLGIYRDLIKAPVGANA